MSFADCNVKLCGHDVCVFRRLKHPRGGTVLEISSCNRQPAHLLNTLSAISIRILIDICYKLHALYTVSIS